MLSVGGLVKRYGDDLALDGVDLEIPAGEVCALLGPNGAGKTTLVSIVAGLRRADDGTVRVGDVDARADPVGARRQIGLAPQELGVYPGLTARQNLLLFAELDGHRGDDAERRVGEAAEAVELTDLLDRKVGSMSGGEKRRVHTAMATIGRAPLLLLDEVTTGVDVLTRASLLDTVRALAAEGAAVCYSTHYLPEVEALDASVAIIDRGRIVARGPVGELVRRHGTSAVELRFEGPVPDLDVTDLCPEGAVPDVEDDLLRVPTPDPGPATATLLARLGEHVDRLRNVELVSPDLDSAFLALTGRRYRADADTDEEEATRALE